jgi:peptidylprolyl isomerase
MSSRTPRFWTLALAIAGAGALGLAACSSSPTTSDGAASTSYNTGSDPAATTTNPVASALHATLPIPVADLSPAGTFGKAPTVVVPKGTPPTSLESADLITGIGSTALPGDSATVQYVLATYSSGKVVQSSWTSQPFTFKLGAGQVIPGWDKGVVGMKVGGRRELIIPPNLGYGGRSPGPGIAANDTLVFVIDLLNLN